MQAEGIQQSLWLREHPNNAQKILKLHTPFVLTLDGLNIFLSRLKSLKFPTNYGATLVKHVAAKKFGSIKSHDYYMLLQQLLPLCLLGLMVVEVRMTIMRLNHVFRRVCVKIWNPFDIASLWDDVVVTLMLLKKKFPLAFFDIMTHLLLHVVDELDVCDSIHNRWMYPMEHMMKVLKGYIQSMAKPKRSMAEGMSWKKL